ncbi:hypothetical protein GCM10008934_24750 [Virgibacillus salarius]|uniref:hypothetical protein n=1 Tax=Virgibacillus salarius TaxID=447199 RepID=UPI0031DD123B
MWNDNYNDVVKQAFSTHGVNNPELENAISDILNHALDSRNLSHKIWKEVIEHYERDKSIKERFRG